jgi:hypothetical protein
MHFFATPDGVELGIEMEAHRDMPTRDHREDGIGAALELANEQARLGDHGLACL